MNKIFYEKMLQDINKLQAKQKTLHDTPSGITAPEDDLVEFTCSSPSTQWEVIIANNGEMGTEQALRREDKLPIKSRGGKTMKRIISLVIAISATTTLIALRDNYSIGNIPFVIFYGISTGVIGYNIAKLKILNWAELKSEWKKEEEK
jgi:hypothetical protein